MKYRIRKASFDDVEILGQLWDEWMETEAPGMETPLLPDAGVFFRNLSGTGILTGASIMYLAETQGIDGFIQGQVMTPHPPFQPEPYGYISYLYVKPEARGKGLGKALVRSMMAAFSDRGLCRVELHVYASNPEGRGFWERMGMLPLGYRMGCPLMNVKNWGMEG